MTAVLVAPFVLIGAAAKSSSGIPIIYLFLLIAVGFYFLVYRPQQKKAKAAREQSNAFEIGDEVLTAGGLVGHVLDIDGDRVTLETSVGASFVVLRPYVLRRLEPHVDDVDSDEDETDDGEPEEGGEPEADGEAADDATTGEADPSGNGRARGKTAAREDHDDTDRPPAG